MDGKKIRHTSWSNPEDYICLTDDGNLVDHAGKTLFNLCLMDANWQIYQAGAKDENLSLFHEILDRDLLD